MTCNADQVDELGKLFKYLLEDQIAILIAVRGEFKGAVRW